MRLTSRAFLSTRSSAIVLCALLVVAWGCSSDTAADIEGTEWVFLGWYEGSTCALPAVEGTEATLQFAPAQELVRGSTGCNRYSGPYHINGDSLTILEIEATAEVCPNKDLAQQQRMYLDTLIEAESFSIRDGRLRIDCGPRGLVFESQTP